MLQITDWEVLFSVSTVAVITSYRRKISETLTSSLGVGYIFPKHLKGFLAGEFPNNLPFLLHLSFSTSSPASLSQISKHCAVIQLIRLALHTYPTTTTFGTYFNFLELNSICLGRYRAPSIPRYWSVTQLFKEYFRGNFSTGTYGLIAYCVETCEQRLKFQSYTEILLDYLFPWRSSKRFIDHSKYLLCNNDSRWALCMCEWSYFHTLCTWTTRKLECTKIYSIFTEFVTIS